MWNNARLLNLIANWLTVVALVALTIGGIYWLMHRPVFGLNHVVVEPMPGSELRRVSEASLRSALERPLQGNFFTVNLEEVRQMFGAVPWVSHVKVRREWPDGLRVSLREYQPLGLWNDNQILDIRGVPFTANQAEADSPGGPVLPVFAGPDGAGPMVRHRYHELREWLRPLGHELVRVTLSARHAWQVELDNGLVLDLGRDPGIDWNPGDPDRPETDEVTMAERVRRFVRNLPQLEEKAGRAVMYADLRYPDGFAVRLAPPANGKQPSSTKTKN